MDIISLILSVISVLLSAASFAINIYELNAPKKEKEGADLNFTYEKNASHSAETKRTKQNHKDSPDRPPIS